MCGMSRPGWQTSRSLGQERAHLFHRGDGRICQLPSVDDLLREILGAGPIPARGGATSHAHISEVRTVELTRVRGARQIDGITEIRTATSIEDFAEKCAAAKRDPGDPEER